MRTTDLVAEALVSILREVRRIAPMAAGIVWGVASVFVLVAVTRGFESTQRAALESLGDSFMLLRVNRATTTRGDVRSNAFVRLEGDDMIAAREGSPSVAALSPKANNWMVRVIHGADVGRATAVGVEPQYADIVNVPLEPGSRWIEARLGRRRTPHGSPGLAPSPTLDRTWPTPPARRLT